MSLNCFKGSVEFGILKCILVWFSICSFPEPKHTEIMACTTTKLLSKQFMQFPKLFPSRFSKLFGLHLKYPKRFKEICTNRLTREVRVLPVYSF